MKISEKMLNYALGFQGVYYLLTGIWPFFHLASFEAVTGPKESIFLLYMVSALIVVIGISLLLSLQVEKTRDILFLAAAAPLAFMIVEVLYRDRIRAIYFLDFAIEAVIFAVIVFGLISKREHLKLKEDI